MEKHDNEILDQSKEQVENIDERTTKDKVSAFEMKRNSGNTMLDSSANPVVTTDRSVSMLDSSVERVVIDDRTQKLNNDKEITEISTAPGGYDHRSAAEHNMQMVITDEETSGKNQDSSMMF